MNSVAAIRKFFSRNDQPVPMEEIKALRESTTQEEWEQLGKDCCSALGVEWKPTGK